MVLQHSAYQLVAQPALFKVSTYKQTQFTKIDKFHAMVEFVNINGAKLAYRIAGPEDAPLMITLHGGRGMGK